MPTPRIKTIISDLFVSRRWYLLMLGCVVAFVISFFFAPLLPAAGAATAIVLSLSIIDSYLLFFTKGRLSATRAIPQRLSLGDDNTVNISLHNTLPYKVSVTITEQLPEQLQIRNFSIKRRIPAHATSKLSYNLRPTQRGEYQFGSLLGYVRSPLALLERRYETTAETTVKVYPSYQQLRKYQLLATAANSLPGVKKTRRLGHSMEFEKIKTYVQGDDVRTLNWKATARTGNLMVNTYTDAREQQVYAVIDKGRSMKMPFEGMTLLDFAINASLSLLNLALHRHDQAGLCSFSNKMSTIIPAEKRKGQLLHLTEALYHQQTDFKESDYEMLASTLYKKISQRSLLLVFTNFETLSAMERQLPYLKHLATRHLVCVVFFQNTLLKQIQENDATDLEDIYIKTIAERFDYEKRQIVKELQRHGIIALLTTPQQLTVNVINKYLELKSRQML